MNKQFFSVSLLLFFFVIGILHADFEEKPKLIDFKHNVYSQFGEDGMIAKIFDIIGTSSKRSIEFGACDGFYLSNTANLWFNQGWQGILIECDPVQYEKLVEKIKSYPCQSFCAKVGLNSNSLESLLEVHQISYDHIDLLSIDIDSDDYYILQSLDKMKPRLIICEYNPTFPADMDVYPELGTYMGSSASAIIRVAKEKGYALVGITDTNCFFVRNEDFPKFNHIETDLSKIRIDRYLRYVVSDYSGKSATIGRENYQESYGIRQPLSHKLYGSFTRVD